MPYFLFFILLVSPNVGSDCDDGFPAKTRSIARLLSRKGPDHVMRATRFKHYSDEAGLLHKQHQDAFDGSEYSALLDAMGIVTSPTAKERSGSMRNA